VGRPSLLSLSHGLRILVMCIGIFGGHHFHGVLGAVAGVAIAQFASWPVALYFRRHLGLPGLHADIILIPALVSGAILGYGLNLLLNNIRQYL